MVFFYADENGLHELTEKQVTLRRTNTEQKVNATYDTPFTVKSFRVGKNVSLEMKSDQGAIITIPLGSTEHRQIHNVSDYSYSGETKHFTVE